MKNCLTCKTELEIKGKMKHAIRIDNPKLAIVEISNSKYCVNCKKHFFKEEQITEALKQISKSLESKTSEKELELGIYNK